jgi:pimeloyl-ACP methyl ester carboxylesterase
MTAIVWGDSPPDVVLLHPNGFCAGIFEPLAERLAGRMRLVAVDLPGHGASDVPVCWSLASTAAAVWSELDHLEVDSPLVVGASLGGAVAVMLDQVRPGRVRQLLLVEPLAVPAEPPGGGELVGGQVSAARARRRRDGWGNHADARESLTGRGPFATLEPSVVEAFLRSGLTEEPDGRVWLACSPETEARWFEATWAPSGGPAAWNHLVDLTCPARVLSGTNSHLPRPWFDAIARRAGTPLEELPGGHLLFFENIERAATLVCDALDRRKPA